MEPQSWANNETIRNNEKDLCDNKVEFLKIKNRFFRN